MTQQLSPDDRLAILRLTDHERRWYTVDDKRLCLICERIISGRQIRIAGGPDNFTLGCPTTDCPGGVSHWFLYRPTVAPPSAPVQGGESEMDFLADFGQA